MHIAKLYFFIIFETKLIILSEFNITRLYYRIYFSGFIILSTFVSEHRKIYTYIIAFVAILVTNFIHLDDPNDHLLIFRVVIITIYFIVILNNIILDILKAIISMRMLVQTINGYLLIGLIFGEIYKIIHLLNPNAFNFDADDLYNHFYMSFVVLTSVGLGDLLPLSPGAKALVMLNGVCGQIYSIFFASVIIGKFLGKKSE